CMALLAVDYIPDARKAALEMRRVTKKEGIVATAMWDRSRDNELENCFWDAALAIDPNANRSSALFEEPRRRDARVHGIFVGSSSRSVQRSHEAECPGRWRRRANHTEGESVGGAWNRALNRIA